MSIWETSTVVTLMYISIWSVKTRFVFEMQKFQWQLIWKFYFSTCSDNSGSVLFKNVLRNNALYTSYPGFQSKILTNVKALKIQIILHGTKIFWCDKKMSFFGPVLFYPTFSISYCWHMSWLHHISKYVGINKVIIIQLSNFKIHMYQIV